MMTSSPSSGIVLTPHALTRHAKRLRQLLAEHQIALSTAQSQEAFARVLGMKNWHEAQTLCSRAAENVTSGQARTAPAPTSWLAQFETPPLYPHEPTRFDASAWEAFMQWVVAHNFHDLLLESDHEVRGRNALGWHCLTQHALSDQEIRAALLQFHATWDGHIKPAMRFGYTVDHPTLGPLRFQGSANAIRTRNQAGLQLTLHPITQIPPSAAELGLPDALLQDVREGQREGGLIVISGKSGVGKSTTLAALVRDHLENHPSPRMVTFDDSQEYAYSAVPTSGSLRLGATSSFTQHDVHAALRGAPTALVLGEIQVFEGARDSDPLKAIQAASQSGCSVWTTTQSKSLGQDRMASHAWRDVLRSFTPLSVWVEQELYLTRRDGQLTIRTEWTWIRLNAALKQEMQALAEMTDTKQLAAQFPAFLTKLQPSQASHTITRPLAST